MLADQRIYLIFLTLLVGSHLSENRTDIGREKRIGTDVFHVKKVQLVW